MPNKTYQDAYERIIQAKIGSMVEASDDFLLNLKALLDTWSDEIERGTTLSYRAG